MPIYETLKGHDSALIRFARFEPSGKAVGVLQICHGFGEGIERYAEMAEFFTKSGYVCVAHDQRGFGEMPHLTPERRRAAMGVIQSYDCFLRDVRTVRGEIDRLYPGLPVFLYGHSMGGNIAANYLLKHPQWEFKKAILETPWFRLIKRHGPLARFMGVLAGKLSKNLTIPVNLSNPDDPNEGPPAGEVHRISFRMVVGVTAAGEYAIKNAGRIVIPTLLMSAAREHLVCNNAIREFAANAKENVILKEYSGTHNLHSDVIKDEVLEDAAGFFN